MRINPYLLLACLERSRSVRQSVKQTVVNEWRRAIHVCGGAAFAVLLTVSLHPNLRAQVHEAVFNPKLPEAHSVFSQPWERSVDSAADSYAVFLPNAVPSIDFDKDQLNSLQLAALHDYIEDKYRVSPGLVRKLVDVAYNVGEEKNVDPLLLLAIMAIESRFDPKAQSGAGAQGVMQIMTRVHHKKFQAFGGTSSVWDPHANVYVGAQILKQYIDQGGSLSAGLKLYVGGGGKVGQQYSQRVVSEFKKMVNVVYVDSSKDLLRIS